MSRQRISGSVSNRDAPLENTSAASLAGHRGADMKVPDQSNLGREDAPHRWSLATFIWDRCSHSVERFALASEGLA